LPAESVAPAGPAGCRRIRLVCPAAGLAVPAGELRRETVYRRYATVAGVRHEVKTLEETAQGVRVELLDTPRRAQVPAGDIKARTRTVYLADVLGERRVVEPLGPVPAEAAARVPVFVPGALAVLAGQVDTQRRVQPQWGNYRAAWREQRFDLYVANTLFIAALVVFGTIVSCGLVGYAFARLEFRGREALFLLLLATMMIPAQVTSIPTFVLYVKFGWIDTYKPLIVPAFLASSAFFVFLFRQFLLTIPSDLEDAARIDGCGPLATWWLIMMPLSKPIIVTVAVFAFTGVWNDFLAPLLYINSDEKQTVALGLQSFKSAYSADEPQLMMAAAVLMIIPTAVLFFLAQRAFIRGVVVSGVKG
jgi:multiple sugar transport system permease protein/sn-glycerol 3-phosphate transport system permease protein